MSFQVLEAQEVRRMPAKGDWPEKAVDHLTLGQNGQKILVTMFRKVTDEMPKVGASIEGELGDQDNFDKGRRKFKLPPRGGGGGFPRKRDPSEIWAIQRQHSQEMALRYIHTKASLHAVKMARDGAQGPLSDWDFTFDDVVKLTDAFQRDLDPSPVAPSDVPVDDEGLPPLP